MLKKRAGRFKCRFLYVVRVKRLVQVFITLVFFSVMLCSMYFIQKNLLPAVKSLATAAAMRQSTQIIYSCVEKITKDMSYGDFYTMCRAEDGKINSIEINTPSVNKVRTDIAKEVLSAVNGCDMQKISLPLGTALNHLMFRGHGPKIPISIASSGFAEVNIKSSFSSGGINQTVHAVSVNVKTTVNVILPYDITSVTVETDVPVTETVIVGNVPNYLPFSSQH